MSMFEEKPWLRRVVWSLLLLLAWALSWFTCGFWIILQPFETLFDGFRKFPYRHNVLLLGIDLSKREFRDCLYTKRAS